MHENNQKHQGLLSLLLLCLLAGFVADFGSPGEARAGEGGPPPEGVTLCLGGAPGIPPLLAHDQGHFAAAGVAVVLKRYRTATEGFEDFCRGQCELAAVSETSMVLQSFERQDFRILATLATSDNSPRVLANRKSGITTPRELKDKRIFVLKWSSNHFFLDRFLDKNDLSKKEVTLVFTGVPDVVAAFADGTIDAFCATEVLLDKPRRALGQEAVVFEAPGLGLASFHLVAKQSFIAGQPGLVKKILTALLKTEVSLKKEKAAAVRTAAAALGIAEETMQRIWNDYRWQVELTQSMLLSLEQEAQWAMDSGFTSKTRMPNYLDFVYRDGLLALKPAAVTILP